MKRVLSGIRASGRLHLGNYLGAVEGMIALQNNPDYETFYMVADVHTITTPYNVRELKSDRKDVVLDYLAAGLDPEKSTIFLQSQVPQHLELAFYLSSIISVARMSHLPTYKEKVKQYPGHATMALLNYPVLMASDILIYKAHEVPVGKDQEPHLEVARQIARKMNDTYGTDFPEPQVFATSGYYVPSLTGEGKMSKSIEGSYINLTDNLETIKERLAKVQTDLGSGKTVPKKGPVANLLKIVELFQGKDNVEKYSKEYTTTGIKYQQLKEELAESIFKKLKPIQEKRTELEKDEKYVEDVLFQGAQKAQKTAKKTLEEVKDKMGFS